MQPSPSTSSVRVDREYRYLPRVAYVTALDAPVHIDVGGVLYTSTLNTLTAYRNSKLAKMFSGIIPGPTNQFQDMFNVHYFIDRDGKMFRHILNFLRHRKLLLPSNFKDYKLLLEEACYFELHGMVNALVEYDDVSDVAETRVSTDDGYLTKEATTNIKVEACQE